MSNHVIENDRIECISCNDEFNPIAPGERGTVRLIDEIGTVHVDWDSGRTLGLIPGEDAWRLVSEAEDA